MELFLIVHINQDIISEGTSELIEQFVELGVNKILELCGANF